MKQTPAHHAILLAIVLSGGCQMMRYDSDDAPPPAPNRAGPTTVPAADASEPFTVGGAFREVFIDFPGRVYDLFADSTPKDSALQMETGKTADARREGLTALADRPFGRGAPYTTRYQQIGRFDDDAGVRAAAIRALNRSRDGSATGVFIEVLKDQSPQVRLEAAKALVNVPDTTAVAPLTAMLNNTAEPIDNRIAAADALRHYRSLEVARALINLLSDRDFGLAWQARQSLRTMTGEDRFYSQAAWLALLSEKDVLS